MKVPCEVIRDVLPLYAEDMVSDATKKMVEEHLEDCVDCTNELQTLKQNQEIPVTLGTGSLQRVKTSIRNRRVLTVLAVLMTLVCIGVTTYVFLNVPVYLSAGDAIEGVYLQDDGGLVIDYARGNTGLTGIRGVLGGTESFYCTTTRYDWLKGRILDDKLEAMTQEQVEEFIKEQYQVDQLTQGQINRFYNRDVQYNFINEAGETVVDTSPELNTDFLEFVEEQLGQKGDYARTEHNYNIGYLAPDGSVSTILWNGGGEDETTLDVMSNSGNYLWEEVFYGCIIGAIALGSWYYVSKKEKCREWKFALAMLFACIAVSVALVSNLSFSVTSLHFSHEWKNYVLMESPILFVTALIWRKIFCEYKADRSL